tara:strand:- start:1 stop:258 length:258 start_codon:yes stop_codon:yes gene_type:complete
MKTTILTIATIGLLFTSCSKDDLKPLTPPTPEPCVSLCGEVTSSLFSDTHNSFIVVITNECGNTVKGFSNNNMPLQSEGCITLNQ